MKKSDVVELFGSGAALGRAVGLSRSRISQWPETLTRKQQDLVLGACMRLGINPMTIVPKGKANLGLVSQVSKA